jgi:outer membrane protein assembly factor BamB
LKTIIKMALPPAIFAATILTAGTLISSNTNASPLQTLLTDQSTAESTGGAQCPELMFFGVRGSGETSSQNNGYGPTIWSLKTALQALVPGMAAEPINYPAIPVQEDPLRIVNYPVAYEKSVENGVQNLISDYNNYEANCPGWPVVFAGYSQGVDVIVRAFDSLSGAEQSDVILVGFGDPHFNPAQSWVDEGNYNPKREAILVRFWGDAPHSFPPSDASHVQSWCASGDAICNYNLNNGIGCAVTALFNHCLHEYVYANTAYTYEAALWAYNAWKKLLSGTTASDDWAQVGYGSAQDYYNPSERTIGTGNAGNLAERWSDYQSGDPEVVQPLVYQGEVYRLVGTTTGVDQGTDTLSASGLATGKVLWTKSLGGDGLDTLYSAGDGKVFYTTDANELVAASAANGATEWSVSDPDFAGSGGPQAEVLVDGNKVIDGVDNVEVLNASNGAVLWKATNGTGDGGPDSIAVSDGLVIREADLGATTYLEAQNEANGTVEWKTAAPCESIQDNTNLAIGGGTIYFQDSCSETIRAYNLTTGSLEWTAAITYGQQNLGMATNGTTVYAMTQLKGGGSAVWAYSNGKAIWHDTFGAGTYPGSTPTLANGVLYVTVTNVVNQTLTNETTIALNASTGQQLWTSPVMPEIQDTPFAAAGYLLIGSAVFGLA